MIITMKLKSGVAGEFVRVVTRIIQTGATNSVRMEFGSNFHIEAGSAVILDLSLENNVASIALKDNYCGDCFRTANFNNLFLYAE